MGTVDDSPAGRITIGDDVVAEVVGLTVLECYGVVGMAGSGSSTAWRACWAATARRPASTWSAGRTARWRSRSTS